MSSTKAMDQLSSRQRTTTRLKSAVEHAITSDSLRQRKLCGNIRHVLTTAALDFPSAATIVRRNTIHRSSIALSITVETVASSSRPLTTIEIRELDLTKTPGSLRTSSHGSPPGKKSQQISSRLKRLEDLLTTIRMRATI